MAPSLSELASSPDAVIDATDLPLLFLVFCGLPGPASTRTRRPALTVAAIGAIAPATTLGIGVRGGVLDTLDVFDAGAGVPRAACA